MEIVHTRLAYKNVANDLFISPEWLYFNEVIANTPRYNIRRRCNLADGLAMWCCRSGWVDLHGPGLGCELKRKMLAEGAVSEAKSETIAQDDAGVWRAIR